MATRPEEVPFEEPSGEPPLEPSPFYEPGPPERPVGPPEPLPGQCPVEVPDEADVLDLRVDKQVYGKH